VFFSFTKAFVCYNCYHRHTVAQICVNGKSVENGKIRPLTDRRTETPEPIDKKIWNRWLRSRSDPLCKILCRSPLGVSRQRGEILQKFFLFSYTFFNGQPTGQTGGRIFMHYSSNDGGLTHGSNLFGNENSKLILNPWKIPPKSKIVPKKGLGNFRRKTFLYKIFTYKRPLIIIVGP